MLFLDSSDPNEIAQLWQWGCFSGVTTNPLLMAKAGCGPSLPERKGFFDRIAAVTDGPISMEPMLATFKDELFAMSAWSERCVIKVPITRLFKVREGAPRPIRLNITACMSARQARLALYSGASYVSLFWGRICDENNSKLTAASAAVRAAHLIARGEQKIIVGSIRTTLHVEEAFAAGADIVTVQPKIARAMLEHPQTTKVLDEFEKAWTAG